MKKITKFLISVSTVCLVALFFVPKFTYALVTEATRDLDAWMYAGSWDSPSEYVPEGVKVDLKGAETCGSAVAWEHKFEINRSETVHQVFSLNTHDKITFEFSVGMYDEAGNVISQAQNDGGGALDIYVYDYNNNELMMLRIWVNSGSGTNGTHSYQLWGPNWTTEVNGSTWIKGDASLGDSFFIQFDKENLFSSYVGGHEGIVHLDDANNSFLNAHKNDANVLNADVIHFAIGGSNGFTNDTQFILRSINGVSLKEDTTVKDLNSLVSAAYNDGVYTKNTQIFLNETAVTEMLVQESMTGKYSDLFHAGVTTLTRTTYYNKDALWMSREDGKYSYYGTAYDGSNPIGVTNAVADEALVVPQDAKVVLSGSGKESMLSYYFELSDLVATKEQGWTYDGASYKTEDASVIEIFKGFVAPCFTGFKAYPNYITLDLATVSVNAEGNLVLSLYATTDGGKLTTNDGLFAQAVITK